MRGGIPLIIGVILSLWSGIAWYSWSRASRWPSVRGTLTSAALRSQKSRDADGRFHTRYEAEVRYGYRVNGRSYLGARYATAVWSENRYRELAGVNAVRQQQAEQGSVRVYYNPHKPGESALDVRVSPLVFLGLNAGLVFLSLGLAASFPGPEVRRYHQLTMGTFLSAALLGVPFTLLDWEVNWFLLVAWVVLLLVPFTGIGAPQPFRSGRRLR